MKPIVIVGAGITGCVIGYGLAKKGYKVIIVEKDNQIGGLAKTFHYDGFSFDVGPHRFYTQKQQVNTFIHNILKDDITIISRKSEVYFSGKHYSWPLRPIGLFNLPLRIIVKSSWELLHMILKNKKGKINNFEDYILKNYGPTLYNTFFKDYTQKFLGLSPKETHFKWAKEGMKKTIIDESMASRHLLDILKLNLMFKPLRTEFIYPRGGVGLFCESLVEEIKEYGGEILTNVLITDIRYSSGEIEEISFNGIMKTEPDKVIWTAPLGTLCKLFGLSCQGLSYLAILLYNIEVNKPVKKDYQWCYYGNKEIIFSRITMPSSFSKNMSPEGKAGLCIEVTCYEGDQWWNEPEKLVERIKKDLVKIGLVKHISDIGDIHIEKISNAYPVYALNYPKDLKRVKGGLSKFKNLILAGRTGLFWYNNMDDCVENGLEIVENITKEGK